MAYGDRKGKTAYERKQKGAARAGGGGWRKRDQEVVVGVRQGPSVKQNPFEFWTITSDNTTQF